MNEMIETAVAVHGVEFGVVVCAGVQARVAMLDYDKATHEVRVAAATRLMDTVREMAEILKLKPGQLAAALKHAKIVYREGFER